MTRDRLRVLLLADTHLGFDFPLRPRVERRRRGEDFFANTRSALRLAVEGKVDLVVHAGDLFFRSRVPLPIVRLGFDLLLEAAEADKAPIFLVAGNHERSVIPRSLLLAHRNIHVFESPTTFRIRIRETTVALSGFPFERDVRRAFPALLARTGWRDRPADLRLLCLHQSIESARVGPVGFTFRSEPDVVPLRDLPPELDAVLAGHIHRFQVLEAKANGETAAHPPVLYPGSIERTSFAERDEPKGFLVLEFDPHADPGRKLVGRSFHELPTRPMVDIELDTDGSGARPLDDELGRRLDETDADSIVRLRVVGRGAGEALRRLSAARLRELAGAGRTVDVRGARDG